MQPKARGFSLLEMMIVAAIVLTLAALAIPPYMAALQRAHEAAAVGYLRSLMSAQEAYRHANKQYADGFAKLKPYLGAQLVPPGGWPSNSLAFAHPAPRLSMGKDGSGHQGGQGQGQGKGGQGKGGQGQSQGGQGKGGQGQGGQGQGGQGKGGQGQGGQGQGGQGQGGQGQGGQGQGGQGQGGQGQGGQGQGGQGQGGQGQGGQGQGGGTQGQAVTDSIVYSMYVMQLTVTDADHWQCTAEPLRDRIQTKFFYADNAGLVRYSIGALADASSTPL